MKLYVSLFFSGLFLFNSSVILSADLKNSKVKRRLSFSSIVVIPTDSNKKNNNKTVSKEDALHDAVSRNDAQKVKALVDEKVSVDALDKNGKSAVDKAFHNKRHHLVLLMGGR
jgi:hypothetical protein